MSILRFCTCSLAILFVAGATAMPAQAAPIPITNFSFESVDVADGGVGAATGWTTVGSAFAFDPTVAALPSGTTDGAQVLFLQTMASASQTLSAVLTANTAYDLRVDVGSRADFNFIDGYQVALLAGTTVLGTASSPLPTAGSFVLAQVLYTALAGDPLLGQALSIRLSSVATGSRTALMDNVRLDATSTQTSVPEPGSLALLGTGVVAVFASRRRRLSPR